MTKPKPTLMDPEPATSSSMEIAACVCKDMPWDEAIERLERAGFQRAAYAKSQKRAWPEGLDAMAHAPAPSDPSKFRHHALYYHEDGFIITMSSTQGGVARGAQRLINQDFQPNLQKLNDLNVYHQVDVGSQAAGSRRNSFATGGFTWQGDGTMVFIGHADVVNGNVGSLGALLESAHHHARPIPLSRWTPEFLYIEPQLYSQAPHSSIASESNALSERFAERLRHDWRAFHASLPPILTHLVCPPHGMRHNEATKPLRGDKIVGRACHANAYFAKQLHATQSNWPSAADSAMMRSWSQAIEKLGVDESTQPALIEIPNPRQLVAGGSCALHAISSFESAHALTAIAWIEAQAPQDIEAWLAMVDASGSTPASVAFLEAMKSAGSYWSSADNNVFDYFLDKGWLGVPGELGRALESSPAGRQRSGESPRPLTVNQALLIDRIDLACLDVGLDWVERGIGPGGEYTSRAESVGRLLGQLQPADGAARALWEAMILRVSTAVADKPPTQSPRL